MRLILIFLFSFFLSFSQEQKGFWVVVGVNQPNFKTNLGPVSNIAGFNYGLAATLGTHEKYNFLVEIVHVDNKFEVSTSTSKKYIFNNGSSTLGIYPNFYFIVPKEDEIYIGAQAGLNVGFVSFNDNNSYDSITFQELNYGVDASNLKSYTKTFDYGAGFGLTAGYNRFKLNLRYNIGFSEMFNDTSDMYDGTITGKKRNISLTLMFRLFNGS